MCAAEPRIGAAFQKRPDGFVIGQLVQRDRQVGLAVRQAFLIAGVGVGRRFLGQFGLRPGEQLIFVLNRAAEHCRKLKRRGVGQQVEQILRIFRQIIRQNDSGIRAGLFLSVLLR